MKSNGSNGDWKGKVNEWRGYVGRFIEDIDKSVIDFRESLDTIEAKNEHTNNETQRVVVAEMNKLTLLIRENKAEIDEEITCVNSRVNKLYIKVAGIAAGMGILISVAVKIIAEKVF